MQSGESISHSKTLRRIALIRRAHSSAGGAELYTQRLIDALVHTGIEVELFAESWPESNARLHSIPRTGTRAEAPRRFAEGVKAALETSGSYDVIFSLERTLKQDVYRAGDGVHRAWLRAKREFSPAWKRFLPEIGGFHHTMRSLEKAVFSPENTGSVIVNSEMVRREILEFFDFPTERIHLVRNGIDLERFRPSATSREQARARFGLREGEFTLAFVGSGWERKGLRFALEAFTRMRDPQMRFLVAGRGKWRLPSGVLPVGAIREVEQVYWAADLFLFPPIYEPSANVCFEALAAGLPVITTAANGASEILQEGVTGHVLARPDATGPMLEAIRYWKDRALARIPSELLPDLSLARNVRETIAVLSRCRP